MSVISIIHYLLDQLKSMSDLVDGIIKNPKIGFKFDNSNLQLKQNYVSYLSRVTNPFVIIAT